MAATEPHPVSVRVTLGFGGLAARRDQWEDLFRARPHEPSASFEWTLAMARHHVRPVDQCLMVELSRQGRLQGLVPLVARNVPLLGQSTVVLTPLSEEYNTHSDLLLRSADADTARALIEALFALDLTWDCFRMARLLEDGATAVAFRQALAGSRRAHFLREGIAAYVLTLPETYDEYLAARSAKFRNHLRRSERKLALAGALTVSELDDAAGVDAGFDALMQIERSSWKHDHGSSISAVERQIGFYRDFCRSAHDARRLHFQWLSMDGRPVAYNLGYLYAGGYHYLKTSYDHAFRSLSPSTVLRARLLKSLIQRGVRLFDFPGEPYDWEAQWTDTVRWRQVMSIYGRTWRGRVLGALERIRHRSRTRRVVQHVDPRASRHAQRSLPCPA